MDRRRSLIMGVGSSISDVPIPNNEIWYTTSDGNVVTPYSTNVFGANIVSNNYINGQGIISFDAPVTSIGEYAFRNCDSLTSITIPNSVTTIGNSAFYDCSGLTRVTIPNSVTTIGLGAFYFCALLTSVTIGDSVTTIGDYAFWNCTNLTSVYCKSTTPPSLGGTYVFDNNATSRKIYVPTNSVSAYKSTTYWSEYADYIVGYDFGDGGGSYTVNLNGQWEATTAVPNPTSTLYDGVYRSSSNYNVNNGVSTMYIDISGYSEFTLYIRSYAESSYDYVMVSQLDKTITSSSSYSDTTLVKAHTRGNQKSGTTISDYTEVKYTNIDGGSHRITILYRKDSSTHSGDDRGYVLIKKQNASGGGDIEIDTTYAIYYTSSDGNVVTPYSTNVFGANIVSNTYVDSQGIISFDGPVTTIGNDAFDSCTKLTSVTIPDSVTSIGNLAFYKCTSLTSVTIPDNVTTIGNSAFKNCTKLTSVTIPDSVTTIGTEAFYYCEKLTSVTIPNGVKTIGNYTFYNCFGLTSVTIPDSVTTIGKSAFLSCKLTSVTIPDSVTRIGHSAFYTCKKLRSVTIGDGVTTIEMQAFFSCDSLTSVTIPDSVTTIGEMAFSGCDSLTSVYCKRTTPPSLGGTSVFDYNASSRLIYVPTNSVNAYKSATNWSEYASAIVGRNF